MSAIRKYRVTLFAAVCHFIVALFYRYLGNLSITRDPVRDNWDWLWQTVPMDLLRESPLESIWYFHAQPPLFNLLGSILGAVFYPHHLEALYTLNILLGVLIVMMSGYILHTLIAQPIVGNIAIFFIALYPALYIYEAYILYTHLTAFWMVLCIFWIARYKATQNAFSLYSFIVTLNLTILTRSLYHPILLIVSILGLMLVIRQSRTRLLALSTLISLPTAVFLIKNWLIFGFFGLSSWTGMNLYNIAQEGYTYTQLQELTQAGVINSMVIEVDRFAEPSIYVEYGYTKTSDIAVLNNNDRNNINYVDISAQYGESALALIRHSPRDYVFAVARAYFLFALPSGEYEYTLANAKDMGLHSELYHTIMGAGIEVPTARISLFSMLIALSLMLFIIDTFRRAGWTLQQWREMLREDIVMMTLFGFITYTIIVSILFEYGENQRFKYLVEVPLVIFILTVFYRFLQPVLSQKTTTGRGLRSISKHQS